MNEFQKNSKRIYPRHFFIKMNRQRINNFTPIKQYPLASVVKNGEGFIALTSVLIMSLLLIVITVALSSANYFSRYNILENEFKQHSSDLAEACVNYAEGQIAANSSYPGGQIAVGSDNCTVVSVLPNESGYTIIARGIYPKNQPKESYTNLTVQINSSFAVTSWTETPN
jgi:hypothetical protein